MFCFYFNCLTCLILLVYMAYRYYLLNIYLLNFICLRPRIYLLTPLRLLFAILCLFMWKELVLGGGMYGEMENKWIHFNKWIIALDYLYVEITPRMLEVALETFKPLHPYYY